MYIASGFVVFRLAAGGESGCDSNPLVMEDTATWRTSRIRSTGCLQAVDGTPRRAVYTMARKLECCAGSRLSRRMPIPRGCGKPVQVATSPRTSLQVWPCRLVWWWGMTTSLSRTMRTALVAIGAAVQNVEAGRTDQDELDELALVCELLARALRSGGDRSEELEAEVVSVVIEQ